MKSLFKSPVIFESDNDIQMIILIVGGIRFNYFFQNISLNNYINDLTFLNYYTNRTFNSFRYIKKKDI